MTSEIYLTDSGYQAGQCVDCGMLVPGGDIICDLCKASWQLFSYSGYVGSGRDDAVQPGVQEFQGQDPVQLVFPEEGNDAQICPCEEG